MALADDPKSYIQRMFSMEAREGRGEHCVVYPNGSYLAGLPLDDEELVYGVYKNKYFYTPRSLILRECDGYKRIQWSQIRHCSTQHGDGNSISKLTMIDGTTIEVRISEFVKGWAGRTSQLYHGMIDRWGHKVSFGPLPITVQEFFQRAEDAYAFAPNLEPHPALDELKAALTAIERLPSVKRVLLLPTGPEEELAVNCLLVVANLPSEDVIDFAQKYGASYVGAPSERGFRNAGSTNPNDIVYEVLWD